MTLTRAVAAVLITMLLLGAAGSGIGYLLGRFNPGYYRSVFLEGGNPQFDPIRVGIGHGLVQGAVGGAVVGLAIVALLCWRDVRRARLATVEPPGDVPRGNTRAGRVLLVTAGLLALMLCSGATFLAGSLMADRAASHRRYVEERELLAPVLAGDPSFATLELDERSRGGVELVGSVPSQDDKARLHAAVIRAVGVSRAEAILSGVRVGP